MIADCQVSWSRFIAYITSHRQFSLLRGKMATKDSIEKGVESTIPGIFLSIELYY